MNPMKKLAFVPLLSLAFAFPGAALAVTQNVTINFTLNNLTLAEVEQFNTYISYNASMEPKTLLSGCTPPAAGSGSPYSLTCPNVTIEQFPAYFKIAPVVSGVEVASAQQEVEDPNPPALAPVAEFRLVPTTEPDQTTSPGTIFHWAMETLPSSTTVSDIGDVTITKHLYDGTSSPGVAGNCLEQTGVWQTYKFPMTTFPTTKGTISFYLKHIYSSADNNPTSRYFFKSNNTETASSIYAWVSNDDIWFYIYDSSGTYHRIYKQADTWAANTWYKYEFSWDETTGYMGMKRDGTVIAETTGTSWDSATPNWGSQDFYIGYSYEIGAFDEFTIYTP